MFETLERGHHYYGSCAEVFGEERERHIYIVAALAVLAVAATAVQTYSSIQQAEQQADEQKAVFKQKQIEAQAAQESAAYEERQQRRQIAFALGKQQAITAAAGLSTTDGTPFLQELDLVAQGELEALSIRRHGRLASSVSEFEGNIARYRRETAKSAVPLIAASGALQASSQVAGSAWSYKSYQTRVR